jgi:hypothetical protein
MRTVIANAKLSEEILPEPNAEWDALQIFALTFNGYDQWGSSEKCAELSNQCLALHRKEGVLPETLKELRTCLFYEQRRWRHFGDDPDSPTLVYLRALIEAIRVRVRDQQLD